MKKILSNLGSRTSTVFFLLLVTRDLIASGESVVKRHCDKSLHAIMAHPLLLLAPLQNASAPSLRKIYVKEKQHNSTVNRYHHCSYKQQDFKRYYNTVTHFITEVVD